MQFALIPVLAADPGSYIGIVILVIGFISWIMNLAQNAKQTTTPKRRPRSTSPRTKADASDDFFQDARPDEVRNRRGRDEFDEDVEIEIVDEPERRRPANRPQSRPAKSPAQRPRKQGSRKQPARTDDAIVAVVEEPHRLDPAGIGRHVNDYIGHHVDDSVAQHLGVFTGGAQTVDRAANPQLERFRTLLREPGGVQQAVLMAEILARPKSLR